jgi:hypothetical protein
MKWSISLERPRGNSNAQESRSFDRLGQKIDSIACSREMNVALSVEALIIVYDSDNK